MCSKPSEVHDKYCQPKDSSRIFWWEGKALIVVRRKIPSQNEIKAFLIGELESRETPKVKIKECFMSISRILGIILFVVGVVLLVFALNSSHAVVDKVSEAVTGRYTHTTITYLISGLAAVIGGAALCMTCPQSG